MIVASVAILAIQAILIITIMIRDTLSPSRDALSMKTFFLAGFLLFQSSSGIFTLVTGEYDRVLPADLGSTGIQFALISSLFLLLMLFFYERGWFVARIAARESTQYTVSDTGLIMVGVVALTIGVLLREVLGKVPVIGVLTDMLSTGAYCTAIAAVGWAWARKPYNFVAFLAFIIVGAATSVLLLHNAFSRRGLVAAVLTTIWAGYFARWRFDDRKTLVFRTAIIGTIGLGIVLLQSATRGEDGKGGSISDYMRGLSRMEIRDFTDAALGMANGQFAGANSMWVIESVPKTMEYWPLHSLRYFVTQPIPRVIWAGKPWSLGNEMVLNAGITGVKKEDFSLGPGIVGHLVLDFAYIAIPLYALIIGLVLRYIDDRVRINAANPFIVIPFGAAAAQILALPRGELGLFAFNALAWIVGATIAIRLIAPAVRKRVEPEDFDDFDIDEFNQEATADADQTHAGV